MKILYIYGEHDYSALDYEKRIGEKKALDIIGDVVDKAVELYPDHKELGGIFGEVRWFGDIDPEFIDFIRDDIQDYDDTKHTNFYILK